jgi:hypothetical protein
VIVAWIVIALLVFFLVVLPILGGIIVILTGGFAALSAFLHLTKK